MVHNTNVEIVEFADDMAHPIKTLNYEWLQKYFRVEDSDVLTLCNPKKYIIDIGGYIYYAKLNG